MNFCPNKNLPSWTELVKSVGEDKAYNLWAIFEGEVPSEYYTLQLIKPEVEELFEQNPELANAVYEALGFKEKSKERNLAFSETINNVENAKIGEQVSLHKIFPHVADAFVTKTKDNKYYVEHIESLFTKQEFEDYLLDSFKPTEKESDVRYLGITTQQKQEAQQLYSQYLDTIFPDSKVKDIVYHGTDAQFEKFDKTKSGEKTGWAKELQGIYFFFNKSATEGYTVSKNEGGQRDLWEHLWSGMPEEMIKIEFPEVFKAFENRKIKDEYDNIYEWGLNYLASKVKKGRVVTALTNTKNPLIYEARYKRLINETKNIKDKLTKNNDGIIIEGVLDRLNDDIGFEEDVLVVFEPEQIHILGGKQDIEGFKEFVNKKSNLFFQNNVNFSLKSVNILSSEKAQSVFEKGQKNKWNLEKILIELQIPKQQIDLILQSGKTNREEIITDLLANYSYTVEINTAREGNNYGVQEKFNEKTGLKQYSVYRGLSMRILKTFDTEEEANKYLQEQHSNPTNHYSNLTVPGGTNYTENEIATPAITPSIKGHAQFATDNGIGWFRSDEQGTNKHLNKIEYLQEDYDSNSVDAYSDIDKTTYEGSKTRRILEIQSDWGQKQRKSSEPDINVKYDIQQIINDLQESGDLKIDCN